MKEKLYIIGAGSVGGHVAYNFEQYGLEFELGGFFDDDPQKLGTEQFGYPVLGTIEKVFEIKNAALIIGIAFPAVKEKIISKLTGSDFYFPTLIHERAWISRNVKVGKGSMIYPGTTINFGSDIEDFVVINANCSLGHHTHIGRYSSLAPGVNTGGHTVIDEGVDVGIGVTTIQDVKIGAGSVLGGQSMIIRDIPPGSTVAGVPARQLKAVE